MSIRVIFFGSQASGKTELIKKLKNPESEFDSGYCSTIGVDFLTIGENESESMQIWD
ncbi:P-loop NTPase family protein [Legionella hackeliae]|uniref:GTP-binding protein, putative n=1 Tax=Legionella hackeliae TaxID=449 RepID=A0A0A8UW07_LEGHA